MPLKGVPESVSSMLAALDAFAAALAFF